jgi:hypothetical protein
MNPNDEKDRYGDKLRDLERAREDKYYADRDKELIEKMRREKAAGGTDKAPADDPAGGTSRKPEDRGGA